jgi:hypothetical protein
VCQLLVESLDATLQPLYDRKLGVDSQPQGADFRGFCGGEVFVEVFDEANDHVRAFPVKLVELLTGEHENRASGGKVDARGRAGM